jgi:hypothetical protein
MRMTRMVDVVRARAPANRVAHPATAPEVDVNCTGANPPGRAQRTARKRQGWPSFGGGKNGGVRTLFTPTHRARRRAHHEVLQMTKHKKSIEDVMIIKARKHADEMLARLVEIANAEPASHVSVKAAETVISLAREKTAKESNPLNFEFLMRR